MKKLLTVLLAGFMLVGALLVGTSASAQATTPDSENKKVTLCHATGAAKNPYEKITVSVNAFYSAGHIDHAGDIYESFTYTTNKGDTVTVPAKGDTSLLAFPDCQKPKVDEEIVKPGVTFVDKCGTADDMFAVAPGRGYTVGNVVTGANDQSITVTADNGFVFTGGVKTVTFTKPLFTNVDCDLPATGAPEYAVGGGILGLALLGFGAFMLVTGGRRKATSTI